MKNKIITAILLATMLLSGCSVTDKAADPSDTSAKPAIMSEFKPVNYAALSSEQYDEKAMEEEYMKFVFDFFSKTSEKTEKGNIMVSPASLMFALDLAAAGAGGDTLKEITELVGNGEDPEKTLKFASDFMKKINESKGVSFKAANAEWFNKDLCNGNVKKEYLNYVKEMYGAEVNFSDFNEKTLNEINGWTSEHTDKMIPKILTELSPATAAVLVNAIAFDGKWEEELDETPDVVFHSPEGDKTTTFLSGTEHTYLENEEATGFRKNYEGGQYSFVAMLPKDKDISIKDFASKLTYDKYKAFTASKTEIDVRASMPVFRSEFELKPADLLRELGMKDAFDPGKADFRGISEGGLYIQDIIHKTAVEVNKDGTKAAAASAITMVYGAVEIKPESFKTVDLDRPFVYAIVDNATDMPVFIGSLENV